MRIFIPKDTFPGEPRVPLLPETASRLVRLGAAVEIEQGMGEPVHAADQEYRTAGASIVADRAAALARAELVLRLRKPPPDEVPLMARGAVHISHLEPFHELPLIQSLADAGVSAIAMELIPRSTVAQKMDALSSQANLAGYVAVLLAAQRSPILFPMMMTPSGTIRPAHVLVIGVGVAGLQAIATARRLGAMVSAFDTRPVVEEQVRSLGAQFVKIELGETGQNEQGYARQLTPEQLERQREALAEECRKADIVLTTAQVFGRKAPVIVTTAMVEQMRPGSVLVDVAIESGGNVECSRLGEEIEVNGVRVLGYANLPGRVARTASQMYSANIGAVVEHFWDKSTKSFPIDPQNPLLAACLVCHAGSITENAVRLLVRANQ